MQLEVGKTMQLEVGKTYQMQNGDYVTFVSEGNVDMPEYRTILDAENCNWYNRVDNCCGDNGRVTGTPHDYSYHKNIDPNSIGAIL